MTVQDITDLKDDGVTTMQLLDAGVSVAELLRADESPLNLLALGVGSEQLLQAAISMDIIEDDLCATMVEYA